MMSVNSDMPTAIRVVAFDLDNTLWEVEPVIARAEERWLAWMREHCPRIPEQLTLEDMRLARQELARQQPHRAHDFTYLRIASLARHAREFGYDEGIAERAFDVFFEARNQLDLFADVLPGLERLQSRYRLATLSNGNADLARIGIQRYFVLSLNARGIGAAKPDPRCFESLSQALQCPPREILYVGDDPLLDVEAARQAGLLTAWMNRTHQPWPSTVVRADLTVGNCLELAEALVV